jgi:hypothetical protein
MKIDIIFPIFMCVVFLSGGIYAVITFNNFIESRDQANCLYVTLSVSNYIVRDINRMDEHKQLCTDSNCTRYFQDKIDIKSAYLNKFLEDANCVEGEK